MLIHGEEVFSCSWSINKILLLVEDIIICLEERGQGCWLLVVKLLRFSGTFSSKGGAVMDYHTVLNSSLNVPAQAGLISSWGLVVLYTLGSCYRRLGDPGFLLLIALWLVRNVSCKIIEIFLYRLSIKQLVYKTKYMGLVKWNAYSAYKKHLGAT